MLFASDLTKAHDGAPVLRGVSFVVDRGRRAGLVGPNGSGKSTLLRVLAGLERPDRGAAGSAPGQRVGFLPQEPPDPGDTVDAVLERALGEVTALRRRLEALLARPDDLTELGEVQARFEQLGGWTVDADVAEALERLGVPPHRRRARFAELSGGEAARALLAGVLVSRPDVLLLDEPTNHLDLDGLRWLERHLREFPGTVLAVSHDRAFLDAIAGCILELDGDGGLESYAGGFSAYREEKARRAARLRLLVEAQEKQRRRVEEDVRRVRASARAAELGASGLGSDVLKRRAKGLARKAKARERRLERHVASAEWRRAPREQRPLRLGLEAAAGERLVARLDGVCVARGGRPVLRGVDLAVRRGDRIAVTGPNGAGKSTLLAVLAGELVPDAGTVTVSGAVRRLVQDTHAVAAAGALAWLREQVSADESEARTVLAVLGLGADALARPLSRLSPGERARLQLAALVASRADALLLDEPTNHLDLDALEAVEAALAGYAGAVVVATHDRRFLDALGTRERVSL